MSREVPGWLPKHYFTQDRIPPCPQTDVDSDPDFQKAYDSLNAEEKQRTVNFKDRHRGLAPTQCLLLRKVMDVLLDHIVVSMIGLLDTGNNTVHNEKYCVRLYNLKYVLKHKGWPDYCYKFLKDRHLLPSDLTMLFFLKYVGRDLGLNYKLNTFSADMVRYLVCDSDDDAEDKASKKRLVNLLFEFCKPDENGLVTLVSPFPVKRKLIVAK